MPQHKVNTKAAFVYIQSKFGLVVFSPIHGASTASCTTHPDEAYKRKVPRALHSSRRLRLLPWAGPSSTSPADRPASCPAPSVSAMHRMGLEREPSWPTGRVEQTARLLDIRELDLHGAAGAGRSRRPDALRITSRGVLSHPRVARVSGNDGHRLVVVVESFFFP